MRCCVQLQVTYERTDVVVGEGLGRGARRRRSGSPAATIIANLHLEVNESRLGKNETNGDSKNIRFFYPTLLEVIHTTDGLASAGTKPHFRNENTTTQKAKREL